MNRQDGTVNWGVLSTAKIGRDFVIPSGQKAANTQFLAIASRDLKLANQVAGQMGIPRAYGSYEDLLADEDVDVVYNPLPLSMHGHWTIKAAEAGKHVMCEKPIAENYDDSVKINNLCVKNNCDIFKTHEVSN